MKMPTFLVFSDHPREGDHGQSCLSSHDSNTPRALPMIAISVIQKKSLLLKLRKYRTVSNGVKHDEGILVSTRLLKKVIGKRGIGQGLVAGHFLQAYRTLPATCADRVGRSISFPAGRR
ncbi:hypothetical protein JQC72_12995 [Polycladomyces sp. WAk]|uniref:Uncharacterized protein n=1 Tax=Polycladomyces zharkentensis TaxID=2807616 RepID=A0ABS2WLU9_9BACL|nr:hypothetical protein [Polycladomyces sp. WAk]MBN2910416.1 hypothetical protein [Polycladomyces sp. WAk]